MPEVSKPHSELRKRVERILGESGYMGYAGDIAEFWESVRDHGWGSIEDEAKSLIEDMRGVLTDLIEQLEAARQATQNQYEQTCEAIRRGEAFERALREIAACDFRGNMPREQEIARRALTLTRSSRPSSESGVMASGDAVVASSAPGSGVSSPASEPKEG